MRALRKIILCAALALLCLLPGYAYGEDGGGQLTVRVLIADDAGKLSAAGEESCRLSIRSGDSLAELLADGVSIEPAEGLYAAALYLSDGELPKESQRVSLLSYATAETNSAALSLPASVWTDEGAVKSELLSGERRDGRYMLSLVLEQVTADAATVKYTSARKELKGPLVDAAAQDNSFLCPEGHTVLSLLPEQSDAAAVESGLELESWLLTYSNGSTVTVRPGETIHPYADCGLEAQWRSVFVICIQAADAALEYADGFTPEYTVTHSTLDAKHSLLPESVELICTKGGESFYPQNGLDAGEYLLTPRGGTVLDTESGEDCSELCRFYYTAGKAVVSKRPLTIQAGSAAMGYCGLPLTCSSYTAKGLIPGDTVASVKLSGSQLAVGSSSNEASGARIVRDGRDVTDSYEISYEQGSLTIDTPIPITVKPAYRKTEYCGRNITADSYEISAGALAAGDVISSVSYGGGSEAVCGSAATKIDSLTISHGGQDVTGSYKITLETGVIRVLPCSDRITISAKDGEKIYDGAPLTESGCSFSGLDSAFTLTASTSGQALIPGEICVNRVSSYQILDSHQKDVTDSFSNVELVDGSLTVYKRPIIISAANARKTYDGTELRVETLSNAEKGITGGYLVEGGLVDGHGITRIRVNGSGTSIGKYVTSVESGSVVITDSRNNGEDVTSRYDITLKNGMLEIISGKDSIPVTVKAASGDWVYDGKAHSLNEYTVEGLVDGDKVARLVFNSGSAITSAGTVSNTIEAVVIKTADGQAVPDKKYAVTCVPGELTVEKFPLVITAASESAEYTGRELSSEAVSIGPLANDKHKLETACALYQNGARVKAVEPGQYQKIVEQVRVLSGREDVTENYAVTLVSGVLTVESAAQEKPEATEKEGHGASLWIVGAAVFAAVSAAGVLLYLRFRNRRH